MLLLLFLASLIPLGCSSGQGNAANPPGNPPSGGGSGGGGSGGGSGGGTTSGIPAADHVFLVVLENFGFAEVVGSPAMPYLNSLANQNALAVNYFANTHPSIGNYFMLTAGSLETNDNAFSGTVADDNLVRALTGASKSWRAYLESLPSVGYTGNDGYPYIKHHNPFAYFTDVVNSTAQAANMVPFGQLSTDLGSGALPSFAFLKPNAQNDGHDCPAGIPNCTDADKLRAADNWLRNNVDPVIKSPSFSNSLLIITFDEALQSDIRNGGGQVATILVGAHVKPGFRSTTVFQHQDTLRLMLEALRINDRPNASGSANSMDEFFQ